MTETGSGTSGPFYLRDAKAVCKITSNSGGGFTVKRLSQTLSTAAELAAAPEYVNTNAYNLLKNSSFAFKLPFDLDFTEAKAYFSRFGISRHQLMYDFQGPVPADESIAAEMLGLTDSEGTGSSPRTPGQPAFWTRPRTPPATWRMSILPHQIGPDIYRAQLCFRLNISTSTISIRSRIMFLFPSDLSCDKRKTIKNLTDTTLDRIHRFCGCNRKPVEFETLDEIISQPNLGNLDLSDACLIKVAAGDDLERNRYSA